MSKTVRWIQRLGLLILAASSWSQAAHLGAATGKAGSEPEPTAAVSSWTSPILRADPVLERFRGEEKRATYNRALSRFLISHGTDWEIRWDLANDRPHLIQGSGIPLLFPASNRLEGNRLEGNRLERNRLEPRGGRGSEASDQRDLDQVEAVVRRFLWDVSDLLRVDPSDLVLDRSRSRVSGRWRQRSLLELQQTHSGLPVEGARVFVRINHGRIVQFGTDRIADVDLDVEPWIPREDALAKVHAALSVSPGEVSTLAIELKILPVFQHHSPSWSRKGRTYSHRLVWEMKMLREADGGIFRLRLDAHGGEVLEVVNLRVFGEATAKVHGPWSTEPISVPLPSLWVEHQGLRQTDEAGRFEYQGGEASASLSGVLIEVADECGSSNLVSWDGVLDFAGDSGSDCSTPAVGGAGNTQAARDAYYHLTRGYQALIDELPAAAAIPMPLIAQTNKSNMSCEAYWNELEGSFSFSRSGEGCVNSAEVPGILLHEVGHAADSVLGGTAVEGASGEAQADIFAFLQTGDTCIGRGLRPGAPCHGCDPLCTGVRDLGMFAEGGAAPVASPATLEAPDGLACDRFACPYLGSSTLQGPLGYQAHCESQIASSALLDLYLRLVAVRGESVGKRALEELWFASLPVLGGAYRLTSPGQICQADNAAVDGCGAANWYSVLLMADDDDGNLANGTPNGCLIWDAFNVHGIACGASPACFCKDGGGVADAGPGVTLCAGEQAVLGTLGHSGGSFRWQPGGETTPQIQVSPNHTTEYFLTATSSCGETYDSARVTVVACDGFEEDFESGGEGWAASGLWHTVDSTPCVSPPASEGAGAMYYGVDSSCDVDTGGWNSGDLVSPPIAVVPGKQILAFDYYLASLARAPVGRAELAVKIEGDEAWQPRWAVAVADLAGDSWQTAPTISLEPYLGQTVRLRFRFEAYDLDEGSNHYLGWLVDNVKVFDGLKPEAGDAPIVSLGEVPSGPLSECVCVRCHFSASDAEDGDLSEILAWTSNLDGPVGSGSRSALILSPGDHVITATVTDYGGRSSSLSIPLQIVEGSVACGLEEWPPAEPRLHCSDDDN